MPGLVTRLSGKLSGSKVSAALDFLDSKESKESKESKKAFFQQAFQERKNLEKKRFSKLFSELLSARALLSFDTHRLFCLVQTLISECFDFDSNKNTQFDFSGLI